MGLAPPGKRAPIRSGLSQSLAQMPAITLRQLEIFAQAVEHGSFRRCAEHIGISQVAVSDHVRALEAGLGHALFKREAGGPARLTAGGERAYRRGVDILSDVNDLVWDLNADRSRRTLAVAAAPFLMDHLQDSLEAFGRLHPGVEVRVEPETAETAVLQERVRERTLDLAYVFSYDGHEAQGSELVRHEPIAVFVGAGHPLASRDTVSIAELRAVPAIHLSKSNPLRPLIDRALGQVGLADGPVGLETDEYGLILASVRRNLGFVCMFRAAENEVVQSRGLKRLDLDRPLPALQVRQIARHASHRDPLVSALKQQLAAALSAPSP